MTILDFYMQHPNTYYVKQNVKYKEYFMQKYVYNLDIVNVPEIIQYNEDSKIMVMKKVGKGNLSNNYGEDATDVPNKLFEQVIRTIRILVLNNIEYPDITGYNFIEDNDGKVWIIDFEHSSIMTSANVDNIHIRKICNGYSEWNPDFK